MREERAMDFHFLLDDQPIEPLLHWGRDGRAQVVYFVTVDELSFTLYLRERRFGLSPDAVEHSVRMRSRHCVIAYVHVRELG
eukprot:326224-Pyramimonas_sp.AAC.1